MTKRVTRPVEKLPPPVGKSDWATFSQDCYTVDKTLLIKELIDDGTGVALFPLIPGFPGVILEVKQAKGKSESLARLASTARRQIDRRGYAAAFRAEGVADVLKLGVAYHRKNIRICAFHERKNKK